MMSLLWKSKSTWISLLGCLGSSLDAEPMAAGIIIGIAFLVVAVYCNEIFGPGT